LSEVMSGIVPDLGCLFDIFQRPSCGGNCIAKSETPFFDLFGFQPGRILRQLRCFLLQVLYQLCRLLPHLAEDVLLLRSKAHEDYDREAIAEEIGRRMLGTTFSEDM